MNALLTGLQGYKTYITVSIVFVLLFGTWQKWWVVPPDIYAGLGALALAFLRMGVKNDVANALADQPDSATALPPADGKHSLNVLMVVCVAVCLIGLMLG